MRVNILISLLSVYLFSGCATRLRSLTLGGVSGVAIGAMVGSGAKSRNDGNSQTANTLVGAGIGLAVGLLSAYLLHDHVEERLGVHQYEEDERIRFGDLPPNPFSPANQFLSGTKSHK